MEFIRSFSAVEKALNFAVNYGFHLSLEHKLADKKNVIRTINCIHQKHSALRLAIRDCKFYSSIQNPRIKFQNISEEVTLLDALHPIAKKTEIYENLDRGVIIWYIFEKSGGNEISKDIFVCFSMSHACSDGPSYLNMLVDFCRFVRSSAVPDAIVSFHLRDPYNAIEMEHIDVSPQDLSPRLKQKTFEPAIAERQSFVMSLSRSQMDSLVRKAKLRGASPQSCWSTASAFALGLDLWPGSSVEIPVQFIPSNLRPYMVKDPVVAGELLVGPSVYMLPVKPVHNLDGLWAAAADLRSELREASKVEEPIKNLKLMSVEGFRMFDPISYCSTYWGFVETEQASDCIVRSALFVPSSLPGVLDPCSPWFSSFCVDGVLYGQFSFPTTKISKNTAEEVFNRFTSAMEFFSTE